MKPDEQQLFRAIAAMKEGQCVRDIIAQLGINHKRAWSLLEKWERNGWYEYGVSLDLGWLTAEGKQKASEIQ